MSKEVLERIRTVQHVLYFTGIIGVVFIFIVVIILAYYRGSPWYTLAQLMPLIGIILMVGLAVMYVGIAIARHLLKKVEKSLKG